MWLAFNKAMTRVIHSLLLELSSDIRIIFEKSAQTKISESGHQPRFSLQTRRLHRRSLRLPTRRKWAQSGYLCTTPSTAQAGADAGISWS